MPTARTIADSDVPCRRDGLCCRTLDDEAVLYDPAHHGVHFLNRTAYFIWRSCDGRSSVEDVAAAVAHAFDVDSGAPGPDTMVLSDVRRTLTELADNGLVDFSCRQFHDPTCCDSCPA